jgi:DNA polymerase V
VSGGNDGNIVLAITPYLKQLGIANRCRMFEVPRDIPGLIIAKPRMRLYTQISAEIVGIYLDYVSEEDILVYSVDEVFLDVTEYLEYHQMTDYEMARAIQDSVLKATKIPSACGIGPNMLISKIALDVEAKKNSDMIAKWEYDDIPAKFWPITPLSKFWGIGPRMEARLNAMGMYSIGDVANVPKERLRKEFGVMGLELHYHTNGIDLTRITNEVYKPKSKSIGHGQTLYHDFYGDEIKPIIMEMIDDVTKRMRAGNYEGDVIHLSITYSRKGNDKGFSRQRKIDHPTQTSYEIYETCCELFDKFYKGAPIRKVRVSVTNLKPKKNYYQLNLFEDSNTQIKRQNIAEAVDGIKIKYGKNSILRGISYTKKGNARHRNTLIGGHNGD